MTTTLSTLIALCAPLVHPATMRALVAVESAANPYAVSLNYPERLASTGLETSGMAHQPRSVAQAVDWTRNLMARGYTVSVGIAQINVEHMESLRVKKIALRLTDLFDPCVNLRAAQAILLDCWQQRGAQTPSARRLAQTLSCFNSGNPTTGLTNGYVHRIVQVAARERRAFAATRTAHESQSVDNRNHKSID